MSTLPPDRAAADDATVEPRPAGINQPARAADLSDDASSETDARAAGLEDTPGVDADAAEPVAVDAAPTAGAAEPALTEDGLVEAVLVPPAGLVPTLLLVMLAVAAWAILQPAPLQPLARPDLRLTAWQEGAAQLQARRLEQLGKPSDPVAEATISRELSVWLAREVSQGVAALASDPAAGRQLARLEERVRRFGLQHGREALGAAAGRWALGVRQALEQQLAPSHAARKAATDGGMSRIDQIAPGMARVAARTGITRWRGSDGRLSAAAALVVEALAIQRYLAFARRVPAPRPELSSALAIILLRFRVEAQAGLSLRRRLLLAEELAALDPAWPSTWSTAVLMAQAGRLRGAGIWFERAARQGEHPAAARQNARWCRQQARRTSQRP